VSDRAVDRLEKWTQIGILIVTILGGIFHLESRITRIETLEESQKIQAQDIVSRLERIEAIYIQKGGK